MYQAPSKDLFALNWQIHVLCLNTITAVAGCACTN